jgi:ferric-dicitrate binding protein FerR (iron transport regulator)
MNDPRERLHDYVDEALTAAESAEFERELARDPELRAELDAVRALIAAARDLPGHAPSRDLWPNIEGRIRRRRVVPLRFVLPTLAAAAAVALFFVLSSHDVEDRTPPASTVSPSLVDSRDADSRTADSLDAEFARSSRDVLAALSRDGSSLDPETVAIIEENLQQIERAMGEIRRALELDPNNAGLERILTAENRRRHQVLKNAAALSAI